MNSATLPVAEAGYMTPDEVAALLRISKASVYRLVNADPTMPVLRLPGLMRFPRERVLRWLRDREQGQGKPRGIPHQVLSPAKLASAKDGGAGAPTMR